MAVADESAFTVSVEQNQYLPAGGRDVSAVVTVTAREVPAVPAGEQDAAEIIIVDCSASMSRRPAVMASVRRAVASAVSVIRDGVAFAIVAGNERAHQVYPAGGGLAVASPDARTAAQEAIAGLQAGGSAAMGQWLRLARDLFTSSPARRRHAILLVGGPNSESRRDLDSAITYCEGVFSCDCRGIGTDWVVSELRTISTALLGSVDIVADPAGLAAELTALAECAMGKQISGVSLKVRTPRTASLKFLRQVAPILEDLTRSNSRTAREGEDYPTGAWGPGESRDYHIGIEVSPASAGQEVLAARIHLMAGNDVLGQGLVRAIWTDDEALSAVVNPRVAHYTGQAELAAAIRESLEARKQGREGTAPAEPSRAAARDAQPAKALRAGQARVASADPAVVAGSSPSLAGHVFISYVREDSSHVDQLQHMLQAAGIPVWRDTADLWPGQDWRAEIRRAITHNALVFVACFSQASLARGKSYQNEELTLAIERLRQRPPDDPWLIPVRLDECEIPDRDIGGGRTLTSIQRADLFGKRADEGAERLISAISRILKRGDQAARHDRS